MDTDDTDEPRTPDDESDYTAGEHDTDDLDPLQSLGSDSNAGFGPGSAIEDVDQRIVDLLSWILDTETRAKIYVFLLANPGSTSEEVAQGTGLYPSTVREALAELHEETHVAREKRESEGAGNNPYEYTATQPSELVGGVVDQVQNELNTIFTLDRILGRGASEPVDTGGEPVTITVNDTASTADDAADDDTNVTVGTTDGDDGEADVTDRDDDTDHDHDRTAE